MKRWPFLATIVAILLVAGCGGSNTSQKQEFQQQQQSSKLLIQNQPLPHANFSQLRQNLIEIENAQINGVQTTSFFFNQGSKDPLQICPSIGAPIATTAQLSNPEQLIRNGNDSQSLTIPQIDPNGVYSGHSTGTYVMCVGANGKPYADYWEGFVQTVFAPAVWDYSTHQVKLVGSPSYRFSNGQTK